MEKLDFLSSSDWIICIVVILLCMISISLLLGRGSWFISGYNTATKEEKAKYDEKKLCRIYGMGMSLITGLLALWGVLRNVLSEEFAYVMLGGVLVVVVLMGILTNTICRK